MKILNFGSCNIDFVYSLKHIVVPGETEQTSSMNIFPGGKGLNQSVALARAGAKVYHAGCIGKDGNMLAELMAENGIDISYLKITEERTGHAIIQVTDDGENSIFIYSGSNSMITEEFINFVLQDFGKGDILLLQNEINMVDFIAEKAYKKGMCTVYNPSPYNESANKVDLRFVSYLILNEVEAEAMSDCREPEMCLKYFKDKYPNLKTVLTLGKKGSMFYDSSTEIFQSAYQTNTVDTTAAGDTFTGYFVARIADGDDYEKALKIASAAAAIAVSRNGAAPSVPWAKEVSDSMVSMTEYMPGQSEHIKNTIAVYAEEKLKKSTVKELAELLGYSVTYTQSIVKKLYGKSFSKLVQDKCCTAAMNMLKETDLRINEIINILGYENESFFRRIFKEKYGKTMSEFKKYKASKNN